MAVLQNSLMLIGRWNTVHKLNKNCSLTPETKFYLQIPKNLWCCLFLNNKNNFNDFIKLKVMIHQKEVGTTL